MNLRGPCVLLLLQLFGLFNACKGNPHSTAIAKLHTLKQVHEAQKVSRKFNDHPLAPIYHIGAKTMLMSQNRYHAPNSFGSPLTHAIKSMPRLGYQYHSK